MTVDEVRALAQAVIEQTDRIAGALDLHSLIEHRGICREDGFTWPCPTAIELGVPDANPLRSEPTIGSAAV